MRPVLVLVASLVAACGDGGNAGAPIAFSPPNKTGNDPFGAGGGDKQNGTDKGNGATSAVGGLTGGPRESTPATAQAPAACSRDVPCINATCTSATFGFCQALCADGVCPAGYSCMNVGGGVESVAKCLLPCTTAADCPEVPALEASCVVISETQPKVCNWARVQDAPS
jgi:hypothetical protein